MSKDLPGVTLTPERRTPHELREDVEDTHSYELAYYWYDFPSDAYWIWPLFDPNGIDPKQGNYLGYTDDQLAGYLGKMNLRRDIRELQKLAHLAHRRIFEKMPLIPLWQLDPLYAYRKGRLKLPPLDPLRVLAQSEMWRVNAAGGN